MRTLLVVISLLIACTLTAQQDTTSKKKKKESKPLIGLGVKGGVNFANVTNAKAINGGNRTGFVVGIFFAPPSKSIISSRTEIAFSRQGYDFKNGTNTGSVDLNYIILPQLMGINITKYVQLQIGAQMAYLLNAKADSSNSSGSGTGNPMASKIMDMYNRFDYGAAGGIEIYPIKNLLIGGRMNISFGKIYKDPSSYQTGGGAQPSFFPSIDAKNNVVQLYLGLRF
jgi:Outer membrane protein beta-barrel domain